MEVIKISPRGYCYGVVDALQIARQVAKDPAHPRPIYILGQIVHNRHAIEELTDLGIMTLDGPDRASILEQVSSGTVIFTAHGVSPLVKLRARERGLHCIDATCPDVMVTHDLVQDLVTKGYYILYIGKKGHPEPEGVLGEVPGHISLVESETDVDALALTPEQERKIAVSTQTTLSQWDTRRVIEYIKRRYPQAEVHIVRGAGVDVVAYPVDSAEQAACWPWIGANWAVGALFGAPGSPQDVAALLNGSQQTV